VTTVLPQVIPVLRVRPVAMVVRVAMVASVVLRVLRVVWPRLQASPGPMVMVAMVVRLARVVMAVPVLTALMARTV